MAKESKFQKDLIDSIQDILPGSIVLKNDPRYIQGIPDLIVLHGRKWAALECKKEKNAKHRPNQDYYIDKLGKMSYAAFVYPENREEIMHELQRALGTKRKTRVSKP